MTYPTVGKRTSSSKVPRYCGYVSSLGYSCYHFPRSSLSLSFLGVQARTAVCGSVRATGIPQAIPAMLRRQVMRFIISGVMPNEEGEEELELDFSKAKSKEKNKMDSHAAIQRSEIGMKAWYALIGKNGSGFVENRPPVVLTPGAASGTSMDHHFCLLRLGAHLQWKRGGA